VIHVYLRASLARPIWPPEWLIHFPIRERFPESFDVLESSATYQSATFPIRGASRRNKPLGVSAHTVLIGFGGLPVHAVEFVDFIRVDVQACISEIEERVPLATISEVNDFSTATYLHPWILGKTLSGCARRPTQLSCQLSGPPWRTAARFTKPSRAFRPGIQAICALGRNALRPIDRLIKR